MTTRPYSPHYGTRRANRGAILMIALIVLVAMTLGGIAILRSVDSTTLIAGNLAFKQRALHSADTGVLQAMAWLQTNKAALDSDDASNGYFSSQNFDWTNPASWNQKQTFGPDAAGNVVSVVMHRMCTCANTPYNGACASGQGNQCGIDNPSATANPKPEEGDTGRNEGFVAGKPGSLYYRVTVRSEGPRKTQSYIQAMLTLPI